TGLDLPGELIELMRVGADILDRRLPGRRRNPGQRLDPREQLLLLVTAVTALLLVDGLTLLRERLVERPFLWPFRRSDLVEQLFNPGQSIEVDGVGIAEDEPELALWLEVGE